MSWRPLDLPGEVRVVLDPQLVVIDSELHVLADSSSGEGVHHLLVSNRVHDGLGISELSMLPFAAVSGAARAGDRLVVAGPRIHDRAAAVQVLPDEPIAIPAEGSISAWPVVVDGDPIRVMWATGVDSATVWYGEVRRSEVTAEELFDCAPVLRLQAAAWDGEVQLLVETVADAQLVRLTSEVHEAIQAPRDAVLAEGRLITVRDQAILVDAIGDGGQTTIDLPDLAAGERRRVSRLAYAGGLLTWTTERVDDPDDRDSRAWVARFDPAQGSVGQPVSLPHPSETSAGRLVGDRVVVVQSAAGRLALWYDDADLL